MPSESENLEIKNRAAARLLALPGVTAVGLGSKEVGDEPTGELAIKIFVKVKRPPSEVPSEELIPPEIEGIPTDVIESGEIHDVADPPGVFDIPADTDSTRMRPLEGGRRIAREGDEGGGTMGFFVWDPADHTKAYGITNFHVVVIGASLPVAGTSKIGQPTGKGSVTDCCSDLFGIFAGGGRTEDRDEALIKLDAGMQWKAEIAEIGVVSGKDTVTQTQAQAQAYKVRKRGARTGLTGGVIRALSATTHESDNTIVIKPNPNPAAGTRTVFFVYEGDSGSGVVNDANKIVALIRSRDDSGNGYAFPIQHVIDHFAATEHVNVDVATAAAAGTVNTVPGSPMVATPPELADALGSGGQPAAALRRVPPAPPPGWVPEPVLLAAAPAHLESDLDRSPTGRLLITVWLEHQAELLDLINMNRRVAVAWHRSGVAALVQVLVRMTTQPELALPATVNGQPVRAALSMMRATLDRFASPRLSGDLARLDAVLPDVAGLTYPEIIDSLGTG
jgi:hypothetical protein